MNAQEILTKVFELVGEPSDLCPYLTPGDSSTFDTTMGNSGIVKLLPWINQAQVRIANWQFTDGHMLRCRSLFATKYFQNKAAITGTLVSATASTAAFAGFSPLNALHQFDGWIIELTGGTGSGQKALIIDSTGTLATDCTVTLHKAWETTPDSTTTFKLYKRFYKFIPNPTALTYETYHIDLDPKDGLDSILKVIDVEGQNDLAVISRTDMLTGTIISNGIGSSYARFGDTLYFDSAYDSLRTYQLFYYRHPTKLALYTDVPELPSPFHEAMIMWAAHSLQMRSQDFTGAYATKRDLQELMQTLRMQGSFEGMYEEGGMVIWE